MDSGSSPLWSSEVISFKGLSVPWVGGTNPVGRRDDYKEDFPLFLEVRGL